MPTVVVKVFLSTTAKDLAAYRDKVHDHLNDSGFCRCVSQKTMGPEDATAIEFCRTQAQSADVFVGLIGLRRGWEPDGYEPKRSITEMEHDWATEAGRRRYLWIVPDDFPVPGNIRENDQQHERQMGFRARLMADGERIVSQKGFESPDLLAAQILQRLQAALHSDPIHYVRETIPQLEQLPDAIVSKLMAALDARGDTKKAESAGLERDTIINLARRINPDEALDFDQATAELENAVGIALEAIAKGNRPSNQDDFVKNVLARIAAQTKAGQFDRAAQEVDGALAELNRREQEQQETLKRSRITLLEAGIEQDILRRDASAVARRVERIVASEHPDEPAQRFDALRRRKDAFDVEGCDKGLNFSLEIAIEIARLALNSAQDADERGAALNDLGSALWSIGERESGTARLGHDPEQPR